MCNVEIKVRKESSVSDRMNELEDIHSLVTTEKVDIPKDVRKRFWKLVRQIKRESSPDHDEVQKATEIRNILFYRDRGRLYPISSYMALQTLFGALSFIIFYLGLLMQVSWFGILSWGIMDIIAILVRFIGLFFVVALLYPYGRLIAGKVLGIKSEAVCFDEYHEPTIKIDYETFLLANPPRRKWYFFFSGLWTLITASICGTLGWFLAGDILGYAFSILLIIFYIFVIGTGTTKHSRGEMAHYNREKKIENAWRRKQKESVSESP